MPQLCHFWGVGSVARPVAGTVLSSSGLFPTVRNRTSADRLRDSSLGLRCTALLPSPGGGLFLWVLAGMGS